MPHPCPHHCPSGSAGHGALVVVAAGAAVATAIGTYIGEILWTAGTIAVVLTVVGMWYLVHVLRADRQHITGRPAVRSLADAQAERLALDVAAPAGGRRDLPFITKERKSLTDGALRQPVVLRQRLLARDTAGDVPAVDPVPEIVGKLTPRRRRAIRVDDHGSNVTDHG